ncbi:UDP-2,4-diacetamido-2,4,6-trideoxy-beta-L-altropyranose hydrolase [Sulfuricurvum sp.]|uniref:UDP-2,4-diacetamido-2,4, 6-trideoxy-beta-L-altropyranose hydrolase n=1 Tax=Sulfuricurvum sp. TaxID=2025608 RepID=UPI002625AC37|nr:UDP-2,4-diacetamido-2,4,6-trideoxy-beta-L-altropyranose hydrolase [Sulfuricurvum sp.]MDD2780480.1 UDP-2,4-diacetamido-2,4,6-trideoxy-beta-L-altropyranose hydrolase [Sulfuricurvum sp.]
MKTLIRSDSSSSIGVGHIMRDLVLAKRLGGKIFFACMELEGNIIEQISYPLYTLTTNTPEELITLIQTEGFERVIFDHYGINAHFEKQIKEQTAVEIIALDDTYQKHHCDILLNHNIYADPKKYTSLVPIECILWCGSEHTLIREEFIAEQKIVREKVYDLLIAMGGADTTDQIGKIMQSVSENIQIAILTTTANHHLDALQTYAKAHPKVHLFINSNDVARIMNQSKKAILTPSTIAHEAIYMGLPFSALQSAPNQDDMVEYLKINGYCVMEDIT